jgi:peptidoglycan/xylan/chitin deacetylase (PgdA/CDA1 family)
MGIKQALLRSLTVPGVAAPFTPLINDRATILMAHRFRDAETGLDGLEPEALETGLAWLRKHRYELVRLDEMFRRLAGDGPPLRRTVAFTIDDGYYDHALIAAPLFAKYDCPVTTFATTGFVDGRLWMWWDRVEYAFVASRRNSVEVTLAGETLRYAFNDARSRRAAAGDFCARCTAHPDGERERAVAEAVAAADADVPDAPPARYRAMTWDELRAAERLGMNFAPHTVTHPVLSRVDDARSRREIEDSWTRLREEAADPVAVFAYPNGGWDDFGEREVATLEALGFAGAVVGAGGYTSAAAFQSDPRERFRVRRFGFMPGLPHLIQQVTGVERFKQIMETGEVPLSDGPGLWRPAQPAGNPDQIRTLAGVQR